MNHILGLAIIVRVMLTDKEYAALDQALADNYQNDRSLAVLSGVIGCVLVLAGVMGACASLLKNIHALRGFQALLVCVLLLLLVLAGVSIWYKFNSGPDALTKFKEMVDDYQHSDKYAYKIAVIQETLGCCGYRGPKDYMGDVPCPYTCCKTPNVYCDCYNRTATIRKNCQKEIKKTVHRHFTHAMFSAVFAFVAAVVGLALSVFVGKCLLMLLREVECLTYDLQRAESISVRSS